MKRITWEVPTPWYIQHGGSNPRTYYIHAANHMMVAHVIQHKDAKLIVEAVNRGKKK